MQKRLIALSALITMSALAGFSSETLAASAVNHDSDPRLLIVTEGSSKLELLLAPGETIEFCSNGCFVTLPNGDVEALTGAETIEISKGVARVK